MPNKFLNQLYRRYARTENGALSNATTGLVTLDYFANCGTYRNRELATVFADLQAMWRESPQQTLRIIFYNRLITRQIKGGQSTEKVQHGQGNRSEFRRSLIWLARQQPTVLYRNLHLVPAVGSWKDLWHTDLLGELDQARASAPIAPGLAYDQQPAPRPKYLPRIRSRANTHTDRHQALNTFAHALLRYLQWTPREYRQFKASGTAHHFQRQMGAGNWAAIDFQRIPGKALSQLVNNTGRDGKSTFQRHGVEDRYTAWIEQQPEAKFTGYVYELIQQARKAKSSAQIMTLNKQFAGLIELAKKDGGGIRGNVWCALDTSSSMQARVANTSAYDICISLGIYFATLNEGVFRDHVIMFDSVSQALQLYGDFYTKYRCITSAKTAWGSTNFQSVIDEIVRIRRNHPDLPVEDFPRTLIVVSDMQFNPTQERSQTNYVAAMHKLAAVGLPKLRIVWWWVTGRAQDFPATLDDEGVIMIGGFDGSILSLLLGTSTEAPRVEGGVSVDAGPEAAMRKALEQEILNRLQC